MLCLQWMEVAVWLTSGAGGGGEPHACLQSLAAHVQRGEQPREPGGGGSLLGVLGRGVHVAGFHRGGYMAGGFCRSEESRT